MEPPADIEQYSNRPSNTGQSSPTLSAYISVIAAPRKQCAPTLVLLFRIVAHVARRNPTEELYVFVGMKLRHLPFCSRFCTLFVPTYRDHRADEYKTHEDFHFLVEAIVHHKRMTHPDTRGLHAVYVCRSQYSTKYGAQS